MWMGVQLFIETTDAISIVGRRIGLLLAGVTAICWCNVMVNRLLLIYHCHSCRVFDMDKCLIPKHYIIMVHTKCGITGLCCV